MMMAIGWRNWWQIDSLAYDYRNKITLFWLKIV
jgi:hypothetical protein